MSKSFQATVPEVIDEDFEFINKKFNRQAAEAIFSSHIDQKLERLEASDKSQEQ